MEVGVKVQVEDLLTGQQKHTSSAYLTFVALDRNGHSATIVPVVPETDTEKRRYEAAGQRREYRLAFRPRPGTV
jgi:acyl-CoA hydrolase